MNTSIEITVKGVVDRIEAENLVTRIRAAMHNVSERIVLNFDPTTIISSAEFLGFLVQANRYLEKLNKKLIVRGVEGKNRDLFRISRLERLIAIEDTVAVHDKGVVHGNGSDH